MEVRDKIGYAKFQHSHKTDGPSDSDKQELCELETREKNILDKIADAKLETKDVDDSIATAYMCNLCERTIEGMVLLINVYP